MNKNTKRLIGTLICLAMVLAVLPMAVAAAGTTIYVQPNDNWLESNARFAAYFFEGENNTWVDCTDAGNGLYKVDAPEGYSNVIFCRMNPDAAENNWDNKWNQTADLIVPTDNKIVYFVDGWDNGNGQWGEVGKEPPVIEVVYYIRGDMNNWGTDNAMTDNGDGTYTLTMNVAAGTYQYKAGDAGWGSAIPAGMDNLTLTVSADGNVTFNLDVNAGTLTATGANVVENENGGEGSGPENTEPVNYEYYVAGNAGLCGEEWNPGANKMTLNAQTGLYEITFSGVAAGTYEYKVATGTWDTPAYGVDGGNCKIELAATSDVTITFNVETSEVKAEVAPVDSGSTEVTDPTTEATTPEEEVTDPTTEATAPEADATEPSVDETPDTAIITAYVPADWTNPCIWAWGANGNAFATWPGEAMTKDGDKFTAEVPSWVEYVIINNGVAEGAIQTIDTKVTVGKDVTVRVTTAGEDGKYNATVDGVLPDKENTENVSGEYRVVGDADWLGAWDAANSVGLMTAGENGVYEITFTNVAVGNYQFKITKDGSWDTNWGKNGPGGDNIELNVTVAGDVTVRFNASVSGISYKTAASDDFVEVWSEKSSGTGDLSVVGVCVAMLAASAGLVCLIGKKKEF